MHMSGVTTGMLRIHRATSRPQNGVPTVSGAVGHRSGMYTHEVLAQEAKSTKKELALLESKLSTVL